MSKANIYPKLQAVIAAVLFGASASKIKVPKTITAQTFIYKYLNTFNYIKIPSVFFNNIDI